MMASFLLAFVAAFVASIGSRDQVLVARLAETLGRGIGLLVTASATAAISAAAMAFAGASIAEMLPGPAANMLAAFALLATAFELAWPNRVRQPGEPTRSLGAIGIVLLARQVTDAARFLVFALTAATLDPWLAGFGGALGGIAAVALGWALGAELEARWPLVTIRRVLAGAALVLALIIGLSARGLI